MHVLTLYMLLKYCSIGNVLLMPLLPIKTDLMFLIKIKTGHKESELLVPLGNF